MVVSCNVCWKFTLPASRRNEERTHSNSIMQIQWRRLRRTTLQLHDAHNYQNHSNSTICLPEPSLSLSDSLKQNMSTEKPLHTFHGHRHLTGIQIHNKRIQKQTPPSDACRNSKKETNKNHIMQLRSPSSFTHALYTLKCFAHRRAMNGSW